MLPRKYLMMSTLLGALSLAGPAEAARMVYGETGRLDSFDPYTIHEASGHRLGDLIFDDLIVLGPGNTYLGGLARSWVLAKDGTSVTLTLREGVRWHPAVGDQATYLLSPQDVVKTVELLTSPASDIPNRDRFAALLTAKPLGRSKVIIHLRQAMADPLKALTFKILPAHHFQGVAALRRDSAFSQQPIGTGPYQFVKASRQGEVLLKANPHYYKGAAKIDPLVMKTYADDNIMSQSLMFHSLDLVTYVSPRHLPEISGDQSLHVLPYDALSYSFIAMNTARPALHDKRVRQALSFGLDRQEMLNAFFGGKGFLISGPFPPSSWAYNLDIKTQAHAPARASELLASSGWQRRGQGPLQNASGQALELNFAVPIAGESELVKRIVLAVQGYWQTLGIKVNLKFLEWSVWKKKVLGDHDYDLTIASWNFDDASNIKSLFHSADARAWGNNFVLYRNDEVDTLLSEAALTNDFDKRQAIYHKLHQILADEAPYIYLWTLKHHAAHQARLSGIQAEPFGFFHSINSWSMQEEGREVL